MKGCFVKQGVYFSITAESLRYPGPEKLLEAYTMKSQILSLLAELEADVWVVEGDTRIPGSHVQVIEQHEPELLKAYRKAHKTVPWSAVPWGEYDVVISMLPIVPKKTIQRHPRILWTYYTYTHTTKLYKKSFGGPYGAYDLFLDHCLVMPKLGKRLPQAVSFPYPVNPDLMKSLVQPTNEPAVFLDSHLVRDYQTNRKWFTKKYPLPFKHSKLPHRHDSKRHKRLAQGQFDRTAAFLQKLGSCKYLLLARKPAFVGQGAIEAAALGLIVVSGPGRYPSLVCHPRCLVKAADAERGLRAIREIEADPDLQQEILEHQERVLCDRFWNEPLETLHRALEMKRAGRSAPKKSG